jgi:putative PIN family toxin of toxin-antitoxin system
MSNPIVPRVVIDTNVLFEGLTKQGGAAGLIVDAWLEGWVVVCVSNALAYEYEDVLSRKLSAVRWQEIQQVLALLIEDVQFVDIYFSWRPSSPDAGDELVIDCAMNGNAIVITSNIRDFRNAKEALELRVMTPIEFVNELDLGDES